jgi:hypothetical protein
MIYRTAIGVVALTLLAATHWKAYTLGQDRINLQWSIDRAKQAAAHAKQVEEYRGKEQALQALVDGFKRKSQNEINRITRERDALVVSLRERPEARTNSCSAPTAEGTGPAVGASGAGLSRPDAEFLAGYAADAARANESLKMCLDAYREVRRTISAGN